MKIVFTLLLAFIPSISYATGQWVPVNQPQVIIQEQIIPNPIIVQTPQPQIVYQLTPHVVLEPVVVKRRRIFTQEETIQMVPVTKWVYQPCIVYK